jgi:ubiquinone/menaquinone biosynthesis C-methylase UbiE
MPFDERVAGSYESWYETKGRRADALEKSVLAGFLGSFPRGAAVLDVGCGTGHFTRWFAGKGLRAAGLDASPAMLAEAVRHGAGTWVRADAARLPFADGGFEIVAVITTLEFVDDPGQILREAVRVARGGVLVGALNRWSLLALRRRLRGGRLWRRARFLSPRKLRSLVVQASGTRLRKLRLTTAALPAGLEFVARSLPLGAFIGVCATLDSRRSEEVR